MTTMPVAEINAIRERTSPPPPNADYTDTENPVGWNPAHEDIKTFCIGPGRVAVSYANVEKILSVPEAVRHVNDMCAKIAEASR